MFFVPTSGTPLTQGDILDECPLVGLNAPEPPGDLRNLPVEQWFARIIVLTQACDLIQAKSGRVLVAQVHAAQDLVDEGVLKGTAIRDQMRRHLVFGWYFLARSDDYGRAARIADRPARHPFGAACRPRTVGRCRQARREPGVPLPRTPRATFRRHLHARRLAGTVPDAVVKAEVSQWGRSPVER